MELRNLITFLKIIETNSFSKAAEQLMYSQSTVTIQIQQLEEELNTKLFERIGKKIFLTAEGHELKLYAQQISELTQKISAIGGEEQEMKGTLRIASFDSLITTVLPDILKLYHDRYPNVHVTLKTADSILEAEHLLRQNDADFAFISYDRRTSKEFAKLFLKEARFVFLAAPEHPLVKERDISLEEIARHTVIIMNKHFSFSELSNDETKHLSQIITPTFDIWNPNGAMEAAIRGIGITLLPYYLVEDAIRKGKLCVLDVPELDFIVWLQTVCHYRKTITPQMNAFYKLIKEYYHI